MDQSSARTKRKRESAPKRRGRPPLPSRPPNPFPEKLPQKICSTSSQLHGQWQNCSGEKNKSQQILHQQDQKSAEQNSYQITLVQQGPGAENKDLQHDSQPECNRLLSQQAEPYSNQKQQQKEIIPLQVIKRTLNNKSGQILQPQSLQPLKSAEQHSSQIASVRQGSGAENQHLQLDNQPNHLLLQQQQKVTNQLQVIEKTLIRNSEQNPTHCPTEDLAQLSESKEHHMRKQLSCQQATVASPAVSSMEQSSRAAAQIFGLFIRILCSYVDKDKSMQVHALFVKLKNKEIAIEDFSREGSKICGRRLLEQAHIQARTQMQSQSLSKASQVPAGNSSTTPKECFIVQNKQLDGLCTSPPNPMTSQVPAANSSTAQEKLSVGQKKSLDGLCTTQPNITTSQILAGNSCTPKKCSIGQKKPLDGLCTTPTLARKKQKFSGDSLEQSIEELNDITIGINLKEEEDQLFSTSKEDMRASNIFRRVVQEEEERLIIQKGFLQKKIAEITSECGIENVSSDVEHCLSLCVEERLRGLITKLIRISIQRCDLEKTKHNVVVTSDVRNQILVMNRKIKEEWEKTQAEKLRKHNVDGGNGSGADKDKDEDCSKTHKIRKVDPLMTAAANRAVRDAFGEGDLLSRWQMMAEQAQQKRESGIVEPYSSQLGSSSILNPWPNFGTTLRNQDAQMRGFSTASMRGSTRKLERKVPRTTHPKVARIISMKDVISVLEREPQMCRSALLYRLYERECSSIV